MENSKSTVTGLNNLPVNYFDVNTQGAGLLGVGLLKANPIDYAAYPDSINPLGKPEYKLNKRIVWSYFFLEYDNPNIVRLQGIIKSFVVIRTLNALTTEQVAKMLGKPPKNITGLSLTDYENNSFTHPTYTDMSGNPLSVRYAEIQILIQKTPGRLDNVPIGSPNFDNTPDGVTTRQGPVPSPPYTNFATATGATASVSIIAGGTVSFRDTSVNSPWQFAPTGWIWDFGATASPTGATAQNVIVTYGVTGTYTVTLTASNASGSTVKTKTNFVIVT